MRYIVFGMEFYGIVAASGILSRLTTTRPMRSRGPMRSLGYSTPTGSRSGMFTSRTLVLCRLVSCGSTARGLWIGIRRWCDLPQPLRLPTAEGKLRRFLF